MGNLGSNLDIISLEFGFGKFRPPLLIMCLWLVLHESVMLHESSGSEVLYDHCEGGAAFDTSIQLVNKVCQDDIAKLKREMVNFICNIVGHGRQREIASMKKQKMQVNN